MSRFLSSAIQNQKQSPIRKYSAWVQEIGGINLSQGVCDQPTPDALKQGAKAAIDENLAIYTHVQGLMSLREALADKIANFNGVPVNPETEISVTLGSAGAFAALCEATLEPGDNIVTFSPYYSYHTNYVAVRGNEVRFVNLTPPQWTFNESDLEHAVDQNTKMILVCTPSNPTGKVFGADELQAIINVAARHDALLVTDEVYEYIVHDKKHVSAATLPGARERTVTISGGSKTYAITGWRIGYAYGPQEIISKLAVAHDLIGICAPSCLQKGVEVGIRSLTSDYYAEMEREYRAKRDLLHNTLESIGMEPYKPDGAFYMMVNFHDRFDNDFAAADALIERVGVAAVPGSIFYADSKLGSTQLRFCYAKEMAELEAGCERLRKLT